MADGRGQSWLAQIVGALTAGRRKGDGLIRMGFAGAVVAGAFAILDKQLVEDRKLRREERTALVSTLHETTETLKALTTAVAKEGDVRELRTAVDRACGEGRRR